MDDADVDCQLIVNPGYNADRGAVVDLFPRDSTGSSEAIHGRLRLEKSLTVRMHGQAVMAVLSNAMVRLAGLIRRVDMDHHQRQVVQVVQQLVADIAGDGVCLGDRQLGIDGNVHLGMQAMAEPPRAHPRSRLSLAAHARPRA